MRISDKLHPGPFCTVQGFLAQYTVQGTDLTTFAHAVTTFVVGSASNNIENLSRRLKQVERAVIPMTVAIFVIPFMTATIGYFLVGYSVSGNWCWFNENPKPLSIYVQNGLTNGPRTFIIVAIITVYTNLFWSFRVRIREQENLMASNSSNLSDSSQNSKENIHHMNSLGRTLSPEEKAQREIRKKADAQRASIMKLLVYPAAFTILWFPGVAGLIAEASNKPLEVLVVTNFFGFTTQLVGFANSVVFGYSRFFGKRSAAGSV
ncbi:hypothetical protein HDU97_007311 [Phlyctochytrium planicorne]|nr:hypothetical protein HDU97_007311 [Phlyctochytrium planicorne]